MSPRKVEHLNSGYGIRDTCKKPYSEFQKIQKSSNKIIPNKMTATFMKSSRGFL